MKKIFSKALCLLLVLVMIVGVMPMAMAGENDLPVDRPDEVLPSVTLIADKSACEVGDTVGLTLVITNTSLNYEFVSATGIPASIGAFSGSGSTLSATYTPTAAGTDSLSAIVTFNGPAGEVTVPTDAVSVTVTEKEEEEVPELESIVIVEGNQTLGFGESVQLTVKAMPEGAELPEDLRWTSSDSTIVSVSSAGKITAKKSTAADPVAITVKSASANLSDTITVTVGKMDLGIDLVKDYFQMAPGETDEITGNYTPSNTYGKFINMTFKSDKSAVASVDSNGKITAKSHGTATITITLSLNKNVEGYKNYEIPQTKYTVTVDVADRYRIECGNASGTPGGYATLTPTLYDGDGKRVANAKFTAEIVGGSLSSEAELNRNSGTSFRVESRYAGTVNVLLTAEDYTNDGEDITKLVSVGFRDTYSLKVTVRDNLSSFDFDDVGFAQSATRNGTNVTNVRNYDMVDLIYMAMYDLPDDDVRYFEFSVSSSAGGQLTAPGSETWTNNSRYVEKTALGDVGFVQKSSSNGTTTFTVTAVDAKASDAVALGELTVEITCGASAGIEYNTTYNKSVTFSAQDFKNYFDAQSDEYGSSLEYVIFNVNNTTPDYGELYTDSTQKTKVTSGQSYGTTASGSRKALSSVTYVPDTTRTIAYTVEIPFTAYGTKNDVVNGYVVINLNEKGNTIDCRGTILGTDVAASIANAYYNAKGQEMGYVVFSTLPSAQTATLYRSIPKIGGDNRIALAERVTTKDEFYYSGSVRVNGRMDLASVALVPAARYSGTVTVTYTAYNEKGNMPYTGSITYTVQTKAASAAFTDVKNSYSWAADSCDFLYYEGTAQGSNNKYNPGANITRGDFMLMLYRAFLENDYSTNAVTSNFNDMVEGNTEYSRETYKAVGIAKQLGIAQGTNDKFNPKANITREEAMVLIYRTLDKLNRDLRYTSSASATSFSDYSKISSWATDAIKNLVQHGVIEGTNNKVNPKANITRAEMACILHRVITY